MQKDQDKLLSGIIQYLKETEGTLPIIVLDNCDKRNKDEQLLMFEVAEWLKTTFKCLIILPMRDNTYDQYRNEPPLDTVVKDLVFRIDPPDLFKVLQERLNYIVRNTRQEVETYDLGNGMTVSIQSNELIEYFRCILAAIRKNRYLTEIFYRLSDRNTRLGIQIFEDFCKSGHIDSEEFLLMRTVGKEYDLSSYKFLNALLRKNRKYYNGDESNIINLFGSNFRDDFPDPFVRIDLLKWMQNMTNYSERKEPLFVVSDLVKDLQLIGHKEEVVTRELDYLIQNGLILCDSLRQNAAKDDRVKITHSGKLHLSLLSNMTYMAACAENILFKNTDIMMKISNRLTTDKYLSKIGALLNAKDAIEYLVDYRDLFLQGQGSFMKDENCLSIYDMQEPINSLEKWAEEPEIKEFLSYYERKITVEAVIVKKSQGGLVCKFGAQKRIKGFLSIISPHYGLSPQTYDSLEVGSVIQCSIIEYDLEHDSFQLCYISANNATGNN